MGGIGGLFKRSSSKTKLNQAEMDTKPLEQTLVKKKEC